MLACESGAAASWGCRSAGREERSSRRLGSWRWKVPRLSGIRCPSRGDGRNEGLGRFVRTKGVSSPSARRADDEFIRGTRGAHLRRGTFAHAVLRQQTAARGGPSLGATRPAQSRAVVQRSSSQAVVGSRRCPQVASRLVGGFRGRTLRRACSAEEAAPKRAVAVRISRDPSSRGEGRYYSKQE
jgi:hypothetical protein